MPTIEQIRAARALLDWSQSDLANHAGLSQTGIARIENGTNQPNSQTLNKIKAAFENADIEFLGSTGLRKRTGELRILRGGDGFSDFLDDVYETVLKHGAKEKPLEVYLSNVVHQNWISMGADRWKQHIDRMTEKKDIMDIRILVAENDWNFPAEAYSKYKWLPKNHFNDQSFYSYHDRLAFLNFKEGGDVSVMIMHNMEFAEGYRTLFQIAWDHFAITPDMQLKKVSK